MNIPEGWKLVPNEPTEAMEEAFESVEWHRARFYKASYQAMLAAAPTPPAQEAGLREVTGPEEVAELGAKAGAKTKLLLPPAQVEVTDTYVQPVPDKCDRITWRGSYYHLPIQPAQDKWQQAVLLQCMAIEGCYKESDSEGTVKCLLDWHVMNERKTAQEDEPVAEIVVKNTFGYDVYEAELIGAGVNLPKGTKLYTRPADNKLRKAAEEAIIEMNKAVDGEDCDLDTVIENLRAALEGE